MHSLFEYLLENLFHVLACLCLAVPLAMRWGLACIIAHDAVPGYDNVTYVENEWAVVFLVFATACMVPAYLVSDLLLCVLQGAYRAQ